MLNISRIFRIATKLQRPSLRPKDIELVGYNYFKPSYFGKLEPEYNPLIVQRIDYKIPKISKINLDLFDSIYRFNYKEIKKLLDGGANINSQDANGTTPLLFFVMWDSNHAVKKLIECDTDKKMDINITDNFGNSPLNWATYQGNINTVKWLLENGAHVNNIDNNGNTPLDVANKQNNIKMKKLLNSFGAKTASELLVKIQLQ